MLHYNQIDPAIEARVDDLLQRMTLAEKVGQLVQESPFAPMNWEAVLQDKKRAEAAGQPFSIPHELRFDIEELIRAGKVGVINSGAPQMTNRLQRSAVEGSRLGIPLLIGHDVIHGFRTIFPIPLAEACTWDPELLERASRVAAEEASAHGIDWIFAPMVDIARDPRWGRIAEGAGRAVADLLFGAANPSGKLTASWPRTEGQIPVYYAHKNTGRPAEGTGTTQFSEPFRSRYLDEPNVPLFPFGYGLSYTSFDYRDLIIETPSLDSDGILVVSAIIRNTGQRAGTEIVQLYVRDLVASVTRPVKELKGFQRVTLQPGESRTVRFEVSVGELGFIGLDMRYIVEPGSFRVWVGPDSARGLEGTFEVQ